VLRSAQRDGRQPTASHGTRNGSATSLAVSPPFDVTVERPVLLTSFYKDPHAGRRAELIECLRRNVANELLAELHLLVEDGAQPRIHDPKVSLIEHGRRATYRDLFDYANARLTGRRVIVANADIYFGRDLARLDFYDLAGELLCLSRWDIGRDGSASFFEHGESQDAWIFDAPLPEIACDFHLGLPGCDNRLAWEAAHAGLELDNPARSLRAYHLHLSHVRRYREEDRVRGNTRSVPAGYLGPPIELPSATVAFDEEMGYAIATLEPGVSSHVNEDRPFTAIPVQLRGRRFTQVVSFTVSPVEVELLTPGKVFVLVGDDWYGHEVVRDWLASTGFDERLPRVETASGSGFEAWSLAGAAGDRFVIPTQAMLVADQLVQRQP
jgi:hypothetical protein